PFPEERRNDKEFTNHFWGAGGYVERTSNPLTYFYTAANKHNDYLRDYAVEKTQMMSGIPFAQNLQDRAMTECVPNELGEFIYDRTQEHLGTTDAMCITVRRQLIKAVVAHRDQGVLPANLDDVKLNDVNHSCGVWAEDADWIKQSEPIRRGEVDHKCVCGYYM